MLRLNTYRNVAAAKTVPLVCPVCRTMFEVRPLYLAKRKRASGGRPICCSHKCSGVLLKRRHEEGAT